MDAETLARIDHDAGFRAGIRGDEPDPYHSAAWLDGWCEAQELGQYGPLELLRMDREE